MSTLGDSLTPAASPARIAPPQLSAPKPAESSTNGVGPREESTTDRVRSVRQRRGVAETSAEAFNSLSPADYLSPKERAVMALFTGPEVELSRQQIADLARMPLCGCCGRIDSLRAKGCLEEAGDRIDPATGKRQKTLQLPRTNQEGLWK